MMTYSFDNYDVDDNDIINGLQPCLNELSKRERTIIELLYLTEHPIGSKEFGMSAGEVAERLDISRNQVNVRASDARNKLLRCLERQGFNRINDFLAKFA